MSTRIMSAFAIMMAVAFAWPSAVHAWQIEQAESAAERAEAAAYSISRGAIDTDVALQIVKEAMLAAREAVDSAPSTAERRVREAYERVRKAESSVARSVAFWHAEAQRAERNPGGNETEAEAEAEVELGHGDSAARREGSGPFGYNAGDEMPPIIGTNDGGLLWASPPAPAAFDEIGVYGTEKTGICAVSVFRVVEQGGSNPNLVENQCAAIQRHS